MGQDLSFGLGAATSGIPLLQSVVQNLQAGMAGGAGTARFIADQSLLNNFYTWLGELGDTAWNWTTDANGNPVAFAAQKSGTNVLYLNLQATINQDVIDGKIPATTITIDGTDYDVIGEMTATMAYNQVPAWLIVIPLGFASRLGMKLLMGAAWSGLLQPMIAGLTKGIQSCFAGAAAATDEEGVVAAADTGADAASVEGAEVGEDTVSLAVGAAATIGFVVIGAIPFLIEIFGHSSYHSLQLYNLTPYNLTWNLAYQAHGQIYLGPTAGSGKGWNTLVPATASVTPPGGSPQIVANNATFGFASSSQLTGIGYVLGFTLTDPTSGDTIDSGAVMFDVPWAGDNSLAAAVGSIGSASDWYSAQAGQATNQVTQAVASDANVKVTATFDYLSGQHPGPSGQDMYWYNSLLVFEPGMN